MKAGRENQVGPTRLFLDVVRRLRCKEARDKVFALSGIIQVELGHHGL